MGVGNADQIWHEVSKRQMDRKSQSLCPRLKFQLSHRLLQSNVGVQVLLSQAWWFDPQLVAMPVAWLPKGGSTTSGLVHGLVAMPMAW